MYRPPRNRGRGRGASRGAYNGSFRGGFNNRGGYRNRGGSTSSANPVWTNRLVVETSSMTRGSRDRYARPPRRGVSYAQIFRYFNRSVTEVSPESESTINPGDENPGGVAFVLIYNANQPEWMPKNTIYAKSNLQLLPGYAEQKALQDEQHKEPTTEELKTRITAKLTESIKFRCYDGLEDGPDMELHDAYGNASMIIPGDWMVKTHELPKFAKVDTPSVKYQPAEHKPIAVFSTKPKNIGFSFIAWFLVEEVELFAAHSVDLARMMQEKKWPGEISRDWAAIKLLRVEKCDAEFRPPPNIRYREDKSTDSNEQQTESDMGGDAGVTEADGNVGTDVNEVSGHGAPLATDEENEQVMPTAEDSVEHDTEEKLEQEATHIEAEQKTDKINFVENEIDQAIASHENTQQEDFTQEDVTQEEAKQEEIKQEDIKQEGVKGENDELEDVGHEDAKHEDVKQEDLKQEDIKQEDLKQNYVTQEEDIKKEEVVDIKRETDDEETIKLQDIEENDLKKEDITEENLQAVQSDAEHIEAEDDELEPIEKQEIKKEELELGQTTKKVVEGDIKQEVVEQGEIEGEIAKPEMVEADEVKGDVGREEVKGEVVGVIKTDETEEQQTKGEEV